MNETSNTSKWLSYHRRVERQAFVRHSAGVHPTEEWQKDVLELLAVGSIYRRLRRVSRTRLASETSSQTEILVGDRNLGVQLRAIVVDKKNQSEVFVGDCGRERSAVHDHSYPIGDWKQTNPNPYLPHMLSKSADLCVVRTTVNL